jgi:hypothetical protein
MNFEAVDERIWSLRMRGKLISVRAVTCCLGTPLTINLIRYIKEFQHIIQKLKRKILMQKTGETFQNSYGRTNNQKDHVLYM